MNMSQGISILGTRKTTKKRRRGGGRGKGCIGKDVA
jgi:hypothetical protein